MENLIIGWRCGGKLFTSALRVQIGRSAKSTFRCSIQEIVLLSKVDISGVLSGGPVGISGVEMWTMVVSVFGAA